ncbi:serine/threonine-protein kinase haspin [Erinaceus europaeus]|uniref:Serine/threonine-protein kinase haspin n=1 Tax=Erinaceus europaeus TaxID=9365 RepID=A0A1S2ZL66_ERIEU|nr:serine/threonine-protein kinase haspin [Erinaceus europaeus]
MAASLPGPGSRLFRTYGAAGGRETPRRPGRAAAHWFSPKDRRRFFSSSSSSDASGPSLLVASDDPDDPDDPDFEGSPVGKRRKGAGRRVAAAPPSQIVTRRRGRPSQFAAPGHDPPSPATTPRHLRLRARPPQKCSTPCGPLGPLHLPPFPASIAGRLGPDLRGCRQPGDGSELGTSASLFSPLASPGAGSPGPGDAAAESPSDVRSPAATRDRSPRPCARRFARLAAGASLRSVLFGPADSGSPEDPEFGADGKEVTGSCCERRRWGRRLESPGVPGDWSSSRTADRGSRLETASGQTGREDGACETSRPEAAGTRWKRKRRETGGTSRLHDHRHKRGKIGENQSRLTQDLTRLQNACSWTKTRASFSLHKKKIITEVSEVCSSNTIASSLARSLLSEACSTPVMNRTSSALSPWRSSSMYLLTPSKTAHLADKKTLDAVKVYGECNQEGPVPFSYYFSTEKLEHCKKIGEGVFGEVFEITDNHTPVALKIIAIEGADLVNGAHQKTFEEILPEIIISKELSLLSDDACHRTEGFIGLHSVHCVQGSYPPLLLRAWDHYDSTKGSANDRPDFFKEDQLFIVLEFEFGGTDLEQMRTKLNSLSTAKSILHQITASLAVAEAALHFEHRDLHWGNILLKKTSFKELQYTLNGETSTIPTHGLQVNIIDYTLSRLERDGIVIFCDISKDEDLFTGEGDYQFEVYRLMRKESNNRWGDYHPYSNVLWLHYLTDKILNQMTFKKKANTPALKQMKRKIEYFHKTMLNFSSATDLLCQHSLFK